MTAKRNAERGTGRAAPRRRLVSLTTAAASVDVSVRTLRRYIGQGRLTGYRIGPKLIKVDLDEVERLVRPIPSARRSRRA